MSYTDLPTADMDAIAEEVASGQWVMVAMCADPEDQELLDELMPDDDDTDSYEWYRLDAASDDGKKLADEYDLDATTQFVILSLHRSRRRAWVLDDLEDRDPDDVAQFMDDHASEVESGE
jgi:hypothetical protein